MNRAKELPKSKYNTFLQLFFVPTIACAYNNVLKEQMVKS